jgi:hypothetical protein
MATYYARLAGNINASNVWATTPSGTAAAVTFASGDVLMANSFAITVNVSTDLGATGQVRTDTTGGATNGGGFTLSTGVTLTANCHAGSTTCITTAGTSSATIYGNGFGGPSYGSAAFYNNGTGTLTIYGDITGGSGDTATGAVNQQNGGTLTIYGNVIPNASASNGSGVSNNGTGTVNITGNVTGRGFGGRGAFNSVGGRINIYGNVTGGNNATNCFGVRNDSTGTIYIQGNVTGGSNSAAFGASNASTGNITIIGLCNGSGSAVGCRNEVGGTITITGAATGGTTSTAYGLQNAGVGIVTINGSAIGGTAAHGARNESTGIIRLTRAVANAFGFGSTGLTAAVGVVNVGLGEVELEQIEYGTRGQSPTSGVIKFKSITTNAAVFNFTNTGSLKTLVDATQGDMPAVSNVRSGTTYAVGTLTGTLAVPPAASVSLGVPVDATTGTATLTAAAIRTELAVELARIDADISSRLAPSGTLATVTTLTNAPTVPTAAAIATQVRTELATELARVDAAVSTRLASSAYSAAPTTAQIATAVEGSLLNEADGQAVLNAIVGAIGNTNLSEVSLVAAVRADLERVGGKIDSIPAAPTAAANATAVWSAATKEITGGTVTTLTNSPSVPSAASIASATRTELAVELARVDVATSTRLAGSAYTAPANSDVTAIKAKTDLLETTRLAQCSTVATTGAQLAAALS